MVDTSYGLAEEYVIGKLNEETYERYISTGDEIDVDVMNDCDCIPVYVETDGVGREGRWDLSSVRRRPRDNSLTATYEYRKASS